MVNVAGIGVGAQGGFDIQRIADPEVPIERPMRSNTGQPLSPEEIAEREARRAAWLARRAEQQRQAGRQQQAQQEEEQPRKLANVYALCDVDMEFAAHIFKGYPRAKVYQDFRKILDMERDFVLNYYEIAGGR